MKGYAQSLSRFSIFEHHLILSNMSKKLTTEEFIRRAQEVHKNHYDYSMTEYKGNKVKVCVICPKHGEFWQEAKSHLNGHKCPECSQRKKLNTLSFKRKAKEIHGNKYDYSKVEYHNNKTKVCIICPIHGEFLQSACDHLGGHGCPKCGRKHKRKGVLGVGINDKKEIGSATGKQKSCYGHWVGMLHRCESEKLHKKYPTYKDCFVCEEWKQFTKFEEWFNKHYVEGWHLDKDVLVKGNKVYSPETCCFVPQEINVLFVKKQRERGKCPIGVCYVRSLDKYGAYLSSHNKPHKLKGYFDTPEDAFNAYKIAKEEWIKEVADKWKDKIEPRVYEAMYNYKVEITD